MLFHIRHALHYVYERPVFLEPTTLRLIPRSDAAQQLLHHQIRIQAEPAGSSRILEPDGGQAVVIWFTSLQQELTIEVDMVVRTTRENPFDWIVTHEPAASLPASYPISEAQSLRSCLQERQLATDPVHQWAAELAAQVDQSTPAFLIHLADTIHRCFHHVGRPDGAPLAPAETLATRTGACRDTAMLYVEACRSLGLAARFVSGYSMHHPEEVSEHELHAWAEVYLPGAGWRGYDPSLGLAVADGHVALTAAPDHQMAAAFSGSYRGTGVSSSMRYVVEVRTAKSATELRGLDQKQHLQLSTPELGIHGLTAPSENEP